MLWTQTFCNRAIFATPSIQLLETRYQSLAIIDCLHGTWLSSICSRVIVWLESPDLPLRSVYCVFSGSPWFRNPCPLTGRIYIKTYRRTLKTVIRSAASENYWLANTTWRCEWDLRVCWSETKHKQIITRIAASFSRNHTHTAEESIAADFCWRMQCEVTVLVQSKSGDAVGKFPRNENCFSFELDRSKDSCIVSGLITSSCASVFNESSRHTNHIETCWFAEHKYWMNVKFDASGCLLMQKYFPKL